MSEYKVKNYIDKKFRDIYKKEPTVQAYNLGVAVGMLELYKEYKRQCGEKGANECFKFIFDGKDEYSTIFRTLVGLYNDETSLKVEKLIENMDKYKKHDEEMSDEDRDLIEEFLEFLYVKNNKEK